MQILVLDIMPEVCFIFVERSTVLMVTHGNTLSHLTSAPSLSGLVVSPQAGFQYIRKHVNSSHPVLKSW